MKTHLMLVYHWSGPRRPSDMPRAGRPTAADRRRAAERQRRLRERRTEEERQAALQRRREQRAANADLQDADAERLRLLREDDAYHERERQRQQQRQLDEANRERERQRQQQRQLDEANRERERQRQQQRQLDEANRERERQRQQQRQLDEANREQERQRQQQRLQDEAYRALNRDNADRHRQGRRAQSPSREARRVADALSGEQVVPINTVGVRDPQEACPHCGALLWPEEQSSLCCAGGKVQLEPLPDPPPTLRQLWTEDSTEAKIFRRHSRQLNSALALASQTVQEVRPPQGEYCPSVVIQGRLYHRLGPLRARDGEVPKFAQLYINDPQCEDPEAEAALRLGHVRLGARTPAATRRVLLELLQHLQQLLRDHNPLVRDFIMASEVPEDEVEPLQLVISAEARPAGEHARRYNRPEGMQEVAVLIGEEPARQDIILRRRAVGDGADLAKISDCHRAYEALHFVLLFPFGTDGWHPDIPQVQPAVADRPVRRVPAQDQPADADAEDQPAVADRPVRRVTALMYSAYRLQTRPADDDSLLRAGRLLQEYCCMAFARVETQRLVFFAMNQRQIRASLYQHLVDAMAGDRAEDAAAAGRGRPAGRAVEDGAGQAAPHRVGRRLILPPTFIGGPRHMMSR